MAACQEEGACGPKEGAPSHLRRPPRSGGVGACSGWLARKGQTHARVRAQHLHRVTHGALTRVQIPRRKWRPWACRTPAEDQGRVRRDSGVPIHCTCLDLAAFLLSQVPGAPPTTGFPLPHPSHSLMGPSVCTAGKFPESESSQEWSGIVDADPGGTSSLCLVSGTLKCSEPPTTKGHIGAGHCQPHVGSDPSSDCEG